MAVLVSDYNYELPERLIAQTPHYKRGQSRLLVFNKQTGKIKDDYYRNLPKYLKSGDLVVLNDTKVIKARLFATKMNGANRELVILEKHGQKDDWHQHEVMFRGQIKIGDILKVGPHELVVKSVSQDGTAIINSQIDLLKLAITHGQVPLPPYVKRPANLRDEETYQTVWAKNDGSVAAPTASLNMTEQTLAKLRQKGIRIVYITLHVGMGTFMPIRDSDLSRHKMHSEYFVIPKNTVVALKEAKKHGNRVVAVGTTVARTLEYNAETLHKSPAKQLSGEASIFIYPGYRFKLVNVMLTNFHAPKSTVLMMAGAFAGWDNLMKSYEYAMLAGYWFLSYGDSMLIE